MDRVILKYITTNYGDLELYESDKYPEHLFFMKDGEVIFDYNKETKVVFISYEDIWSLLENFFGLKYEEIQDLTKQWVEKYYKLDVTKTLLMKTKNQLRWGYINKLIQPF